jgi:cadmium resistance protein CadD (predicted permease)
MPYFCSMGADTIALSIPILAVCGGVLIAITAIIVKGRKEEQEHRERVVAMEKGIAVPASTPVAEVHKPKHSDRRAGGLVMTGIGLALTIAISVSDRFESGVWGLIPLFIGIGLLIAGTIDKRELEERERVARNNVNRPQ